MDISQIYKAGKGIGEHARLERRGAFISTEGIDAEGTHGAREAGVGDDAREDVRAALRMRCVLVARGARLVLEAQVVVVPRAVVRVVVVRWVGAV